MYVLRTTGDPTALSGSIRQAVLAIDPGRPVHNLRSMEEMLAGSLVPQRFAVTLLAIFAGLALAMAALGLYGVISYSVTQRTREIGIRAALGARNRQVLAMVVLSGMRFAAAGIAAGLAGALALSRLLESQLFETSAFDPLTFGAVAAVLTLVTLLACYLPARRATKVDPVVALRYE
ncbi:MAG: FtsX-like permease family protein [bacterium]|nr:FtsX-like permease family protein [bacterium]